MYADTDICFCYWAFCLVALIHDPIKFVDKYVLI
jgi:hypothetical protein